jgi:hypothetical protein
MSVGSLTMHALGIACLCSGAIGIDVRVREIKMMIGYLSDEYSTRLIDQVREKVCRSPLGCDLGG